MYHTAVPVCLQYPEASLDAVLKETEPYSKVTLQQLLKEEIITKVMVYREVVFLSSILWRTSPSKHASGRTPVPLSTLCYN